MPDIEVLTSDRDAPKATDAPGSGEATHDEAAGTSQGHQDTPANGTNAADDASSRSSDGGAAKPPLPPEAPPASGDGSPDGGASGEPSPVATNKRWYVVKVQSGREESIKEAIERRVKIEGLEEYFGQIIIPVERVTEMRKARDGSTKRVIREHKLYPGYLMCEVEYNDRILYLFRETSGVGDFVGGTVNRPPPPMPQHEVEKMLRTKPGAPDEKVVPGKAPFSIGDHVRVRDGTFAGMEGDVKEVMDTVGKVKVELQIFGRPVPVELEYWQVEEA
jgi:transcriptional antiterminator NusG